MFVTISSLAVALSLSAHVAGHASIWHPSMFGFNATTGNNRALDPLMNRHFNTSDEADSWWFHGHLKYPPHPEDIMQLPVGGSQNFEISCDKGVTSYWASAPGGNTASASQPDYPCPGQPLSQFHTTGESDTGGCALAIAYKSDAWAVQPEDFVVFSVNQTCVWTKNTEFSIPNNMPPCPNGKCTCAFFWGHQADSGSEQIYMNGFQCNMAGATNTQPLPQGNPARRCGTDTYLGRAADPSNCTIGAKQPNYWIQLERNNQFEDQYHPPSYQSLYGFMNGAQMDLYDGIGAIQPSGTSAGVPATGPVAATPTAAALTTTTTKAAVTTTTKAAAMTTSTADVTAVSPSTKKPAPSGTEKASNPSTKNAPTYSTKNAPTSSIKKASTTSIKTAPTKEDTPPPVIGASMHYLHTTFTLVSPMATPAAAAPPPSSQQCMRKRGAKAKRGPAHRAAAVARRGMVKHRRVHQPSTF